MKQTAVEWLERKFYFTKGQLIDIDFDRAKQMEKEQIRLIYEGLLQNVGTSIKQSDLPTFEQYYNETYGK